MLLGLGLVLLGLLQLLLDLLLELLLLLLPPSLLALLLQLLLLLLILGQFLHDFEGHGQVVVAELAVVVVAHIGDIRADWCLCMHPLLEGTPHTCRD